MTNYYNRVYGNLFPGKIAKAQDINAIQNNIADAISSAVSDQTDGTSWIIGSNEDAFLISPANKRGGRYIDTQNIPTTDNQKWLNIRKYGYKQAIRKSKTSLYSIILKLRNNWNKPVNVFFRLEDESGRILKRANIELKQEDNGSEYEVVFGETFISTAMGLSGEDVEAPDNPFMAPQGPNEWFNDNPRALDKIEDFDQGTGASTLYLVVEPLNLNLFDLAENRDEDDYIDENTFGICVDIQGNYGRALQQTGNDGVNYEETVYDLYFKDVYATNATYLINPGTAVIHGEKVVALDTHVSVEGASRFGNVKTLVYMNQSGHYEARNSPAYLGEDAEIDIDLTSILPIAIITNYYDENKKTKIEQIDTNMITRPRSHHERLRRLEKEMAYQRDVTIPPRLKYNISGSEMVEVNPQPSTSSSTDGTTNANEIELGNNYFITTNRNGDFVLKLTDAEVVNIPVTFKGESTQLEVDGKKVEGLKLAEAIAENKDINIDTETGKVTLAKNPAAGYQVGMTDEEAKATELNIWDDDASNRPADKNITPTERSFTVVTGKNSSKSSEWVSEFPAMTFYTEETVKITGITVPITKFKNTEEVSFYIWKRQGPNNKTNTVWFEKLMYKSEAFSLKDAKENDGYQMLDEPFTIKPDGGLELPKGQYVLVVIHKPKSGEGTVYVETYKPADPKDFLIRYYGTADASHFWLKERYHEIWYNSASFTGEAGNYVKEGEIKSGTVVFEDSEPIETVTVEPNIEAPEGTSYEFYGNTGADWVKLDPSNPTTMIGGGTSFTWKLEMKGNGKDTPTLKYDEEKKYGVAFTLTKHKPQVGAALTEQACITTKAFYPADILKKYVGDEYLNTENISSRFEFARIWAEDSSNSELITDISASDKRVNLAIPNKTISADSEAPETTEMDIWSFHICDLKLSDFSTESVDYSNYDAFTEYDEHNYRFRLDTDQAYNDDNIQLFNKNDIEIMLPEENSIAKYNEENDQYRFLKNESSKTDENTPIWRIRPKNPIDLTNYSGMKLYYNLINNDNLLDDEEYLKEEPNIIEGLALYISSIEEEETPSYEELNNALIVEGVDALPDLNTSKEEIINEYMGKIIKILTNYNDVIYTTYYKYIIDSSGKYKLSQIYNVQPFDIFEIQKLEDGDNSVLISIDSDNEHMSYIKEIGLIALTKDGIYNCPKPVEVTFGNIKSVAQGYNRIYAGDKLWKLTDDTKPNVYKQEVFTDEHHPNNQKSLKLTLYPENMAANGEVIAYFPNTSITTDANFLALNIGVNCWVPKNAFKLNLCSDDHGKNPIFSVNIPTLNYIVYPTSNGPIPFSTIYKQISEDKTIRSISISTTNKFKSMFAKIREGYNDQPLDVYIKDITLHEAKHIPNFYKNMRYKFYGQSDETGETINNPNIRKIGCVITYNG